MYLKITARAMIDVARESVVEDAALLVRDGSIEWAGRTGDCPPEPCADTVYDLGSACILPGLINAHLHLAIKPTTHDSADFFDSFSASAGELLAIHAANNAKTELLSGVTTLRDCGAPKLICEHLRTASMQAPLACPRIVHCGPIITVTGGHARTMGAVADGAEALRTLVRRLASSGADFIKIAATGGGTPGSKPHVSYFHETELRTVVDTAHGLGLKVAAHVRGVDGVTDTVNAGIDSMEHGDFELPDGSLAADPEAFGRMAGKSIVLVPTIQLYKDLLDRAIRDGMPGEATGSLKSALEQKLRALEMAVREGVPIVAGNDGGLPDTTFGELWKELLIMSQAGMTNMQVLQSATIHAAKLLSCSDTTGSIQPGKSADIIAVRANPVDDIGTLRDVRFVMKAGKVFKNEP